MIECPTCKHQEFVGTLYCTECGTRLVHVSAMPTMNMPAMRNETKLPPVGGGVYRGPGQVMMAGRWDVTVTVTRGGQRLGSRQLAVVAR